MLPVVVALASAAATLTGTVSAGHVPPAVLASLTHDRHVCGQGGPVYSSTVSADARGRVAGALVYLEVRPPTDPKVLEPKPDPRRRRSDPRSLLIDQRNCQFVPAFAAVAPGDEVRVTSSDGVLHNVHFRRADGSSLVSVSLPIPGTEALAFVAKEPSALTIGCDAGHGWMKGELRVLEHRYFAMTARGGAFRIEGVPAGAFNLVVVHPVLGEIRQAIDVAPKERAIDRALVFP